MDVPSRCCQTNTIIDLFSRCLCLKINDPFRVKKISNEPGAASTPKVDVDELLNNSSMHVKYIPEKKKKLPQKDIIKQHRIPRVPLRIRLSGIKSKDLEAMQANNTQIRPITQMVGTAIAKDRRFRSVTMWASKRESLGNIYSSVICNAIKQ